MRKSRQDSKSFLVDFYFIAKAVPAKESELNKWIAQLQSLHASYRRALRREERDVKS